MRYFLLWLLGLILLLHADLFESQSLSVMETPPCTSHDDSGQLIDAFCLFFSPYDSTGKSFCSQLLNTASESGAKECARLYAAGCPPCAPERAPDNASPDTKWRQRSVMSVAELDNGTGNGSTSYTHVCCDLASGAVGGTAATGAASVYISELVLLNRTDLRPLPLSVKAEAWAWAAELRLLRIVSVWLNSVLPPPLPTVAPQLRWLHLEHVNISGTVPAAYAALRGMQQFYIAHNALWGSLAPLNSMSWASVEAPPRSARACVLAKPFNESNRFQCVTQCAQLSAALFCYETFYDQPHAVLLASDALFSQCADAALPSAHVCCHQSVAHLCAQHETTSAVSSSSSSAAATTTTTTVAVSAGSSSSSSTCSGSMMELSETSTSAATQRQGTSAHTQHTATDAVSGGVGSTSSTSGLTPRSSIGSGVALASSSSAWRAAAAAGALPWLSIGVPLLLVVLLLLLAAVCVLCARRHRRGGGNGGARLHSAMYAASNGTMLRRHAASRSSSLHSAERYQMQTSGGTTILEAGTWQQQQQQAGAGKTVEADVRVSGASIRSEERYAHTSPCWRAFAADGGARHHYQPKHARSGASRRSRFASRRSAQFVAAAAAAPVYDCVPLLVAAPNATYDRVPSCSSATGALHSNESARIQDSARDSA